MSLIKRFFNVLSGKADEAVSNLEEKTVLAKQSYATMQENFEKMKIAVATLEAKVLIQGDLTKKLKSSLDSMDKQIDNETEKYSGMTDGPSKEDQKRVITAYLTKHKDIDNKYQQANLLYTSQNNELNKMKNEINELQKQLDEAKFAISQIEVNDTINKVKGTVAGKSGFSSAAKKIDELSQTVKEQTLASSAYDNLGKTDDDLIIANHEKQQVSIDIDEEFQKRLNKISEKN